MSRGYMGTDGDLYHLQGPKGMTGRPDRQKYTLVYAGVAFEVALKDDTFSMIEDPNYVVGDELDFIKVVDEAEWLAIRQAWGQEWLQRRANEAFLVGIFENE